MLADIHITSAGNTLVLNCNLNLTVNSLSLPNPKTIINYSRKLYPKFVISIDSLDSDTLTVDLTDVFRIKVSAGPK